MHLTPFILTAAALVFPWAGASSARAAATARASSPPTSPRGRASTIRSCPTRPCRRVTCSPSVAATPHTSPSPGAGDHPIGVCEDQSSTAGVALPGLALRVNRLGVSTRTKKVAINSVVAQDDLLVPAASGYAQTLPTAAGTYWVIGSAEQGGAGSGVAGTPTIIEFIGCLPYKVAVS